METEEKVDLDTSTQEETEEVEETKEEETTEEETPKTLSEEDIVELKKKAGLAENYKIRAEKAEKKNKQAPKVEKKEDTDNLSTKDVLALTGSGIHADDYDEVIKVAKILDKNVSEALKDETLKTILDTRVEQRKTAEATNTNEKGRGGQKSDGESLLTKAESTGEVPEDKAGMDKLAEARMVRLKANAK